MILHFTLYAPFPQFKAFLQSYLLVEEYYLIQIGGVREEEKLTMKRGLQLATRRLSEPALLAIPFQRLIRRWHKCAEGGENNLSCFLSLSD